MCIVIDTNVLSSVFDKTSFDHEEFKPVHDWIYNGGGKVVFGGSKYKKEIGKYLGVFKELRNTNKAISRNDDEVDKKTVFASSLIQHSNFDDQHIVGLLMESNCRLVCSLDKKAYPFFKNSAFFNSKNKPKIYSSKLNKSLLYKSKLVNSCIK